MDIVTVDKETYVISNPIPNIKGTLWIERYNKPGEFQIKGDLTKLQEALPVGTFISHARTNQVMEVESYGIDETSDDPNDIIIYGRDVATIIMENRVVTITDDSTTWTEISTSAPDPLAHYSTDAMEFFLDDGYSWEHVVALIDRYLVNSPFGDIENLPNFDVISAIVGETEAYNKPRVIKKLSLLSDAVYDILQAANIGLRIERPWADHPDDLYFVVHAGEDLSETVRFGRNTRGLVAGQYFNSKAKFKNGFYANVGEYTVINFNRDATGWDTRLLYEDINDWVPDVVTYADILDAYDVVTSRGRDAVNRSHEVKIIESSVTPNDPFHFGIDYFLGDLVTVNGYYGEDAVMRVIEHVSYSDKRGDGTIQSLAPVTSTVTYS